MRSTTRPPGVSLVIDGGGGTLDGAGHYRGLLVFGGDVTIENLTIADAAAIGGAGGLHGGGGGAGLGGGLFVAGRMWWAAPPSAPVPR